MARIGIDLGTTNSLVSYWTKDGPRIIPNALGKDMTPSVVSLDENGEVLIGDVAKERLITHPHLSVANFKRDMGTNKEFVIGNRSFNATMLSSLVLTSLIEDAKAYLDEDIDEAIISVPAYFNDSQRRATKQAAELAGLKVERLISEPTAAAIAYGLEKVEDDSVFLVFDLGGGTFDVSILELFDGVMQVRSVAGDNHLGGEDFTRVLFNYFISQRKIDRKPLDRKDVSRLRKQCEECKKALSKDEEFIIKLIINNEEHQVRITRKLMENMCAVLIDRLRKPMVRAIRDADIGIEDIDAVILIGGATRMPMIKSLVSKMFRQYPYTNINPDETVAMGASIQAALKSRDESLKEIILTDVCPYTLGTAILKGEINGLNEIVYSPIIERNSPIPISRVETYCTAHDNQRVIRLKIYQGENRNPDHNIELGFIDVDVPRNTVSREAVDVRFTYDINGILEVVVTSVSTNESKTLVINNYDNNISDKELEDRRKILQELKIHPRDRTENRLLLAKAETLYEECLGDMRVFLEGCIHDFQVALHSQNEKLISRAVKKLRAELDEINHYRGSL